MIFVYPQCHVIQTFSGCMHACMLYGAWKKKGGGGLHVTFSSITLTGYLNVFDQLPTSTLGIAGKKWAAEVGYYLLQC